MRTVLHLALLLSVLLCHVPGVFACSCRPNNASVRDEAASEYERAFVVFEGEVLPSEPSPDSTESGREPPLIRMATWAGTSCQVDFTVGERYVVYAHGASLSTLGANACGRTRKIRHAAADLRFLRGEPPLPDDLLKLDEWLAREKGLTPDTTGVLCGRITRQDGSAAAGAVVFVSADGNVVKRTTADPDGQYRVTLLKPQRYTVSATYHEESDMREFSEVPPQVGVYGSITLPPRAIPVDVRAGTESCGIDLALRTPPDFRVLGEVHTADGSPLPKWQASVRNADGEPFEIERLTMRADASRFEFIGIPPGRYVVRAYSTAPRGWVGSADITITDAGRSVAITLCRPPRPWMERCP